MTIISKVIPKEARRLIQLFLKESSCTYPVVEVVSYDHALTLAMAPTSPSHGIRTDMAKTYCCNTSMSGDTLIISNKGSVTYNGRKGYYMGRWAHHFPAI